MNLILITIFILIGFAAVKLLNLTPESFANELTDIFGGKNRALGRRVKNKKSRIGNYLESTMRMLEYMGKRGYFSLCVLAGFLLVMAGILAAVLIDNLFLAPVLAAAGISVPYLYLMAKQREYKEKVRNQLEKAVSLITNAFALHKNVVKAVEEKLDNIEQPVKSMLEGFLIEVTSVDPDVETAIIRMSGAFDDEIFREWCENLVKCYHDRSLEDILSSSRKKFIDLALINSELRSIVEPALAELRLLSGMTAAIIPIVYYLQRDWFNFLMYSAAGKIILAVSSGIMLFANLKATQIARNVTFGELIKKG